MKYVLALATLITLFSLSYLCMVAAVDAPKDSGPAFWWGAWSLMIGVSTIPATFMILINP